MEPQDPRLFLAIVAPLVGALLVLFNRRRPNVREACSFLAAATLFGATLTMVPDIRAGGTLHFTLFKLLPGLTFALRADALSMIFAVASEMFFLCVTEWPRNTSSSFSL